MNRRHVSRLREANPDISPRSAPADLFEAITGEKPLRLERGPNTSHESLGFRAAKIVMVGLAVLLVGVGAAWSATGNNPVAVVVEKVGNRLMPPEPGTNLFVAGETPLPIGLSVVEPADSSAIESLPRFTLKMLQMQQLGFRQEDLDRIETNADFDRLPHVILPKLVRATGDATLPSGQVVSVVVLEDEICAYWLELKGAMCGSEKRFLNRGIYQFRVGHFRNGPWEIFGLVDDRVARVSAESSSVVRSAEVSDNVFQLPPLPPFDVTLSAFDRDGKLLYSTFFE